MENKDYLVHQQKEKIKFSHLSDGQQEILKKELAKSNKKEETTATKVEEVKI